MTKKTVSFKTTSPIPRTPDLDYNDDYDDVFIDQPSSTSDLLYDDGSGLRLPSITMSPKNPHNSVNYNKTRQTTSNNNVRVGVCLPTTTTKSFSTSSSLIEPTTPRLLGG